MGYIYIYKFITEWTNRKPNVFYKIYIEKKQTYKGAES